MTLAIGVGILAASGHSMTTNWAFVPVSGFDYWRVIVTSPEVMIFLFFMITDPKTVPTGRVGRVVFGALVAVASTLLMAPQTNEFGTKVALLAGLVVLCAARPVLDRLMPEPRSSEDEIGRFADRLTTGGRPGAGLPRRAMRVGLMVVGLFAIGAGIVVAGSPARGLGGPDMAEVLNRIPHQLDPSTFPAITVGQDVKDWDHEITGVGAQQIVLTLAENLELENQALIRADPSILPAVDHGARLKQMQDRLQEAAATGSFVIARYRFDALDMSLLEPFGEQTGLSLGLDGRGTLTRETYDKSGALLGRETSPFELRFAMRRATGDRWLNIAVLPAGFGG